MGMVIRFPDVLRNAQTAGTDGSKSATVVILPVIRIERPADTSPDSAASRSTGRTRRRRRPASRS